MTWGSKYLNKTFTKVPGPGSYNPSHNFESKKINCFIMGKFDKDLKCKAQVNNNPPPNNYFKDD